MIFFLEFFNNDSIKLFLTISYIYIYIYIYIYFLRESNERQVSIDLNFDINNVNTDKIMITRRA